MSELKYLPILKYFADGQDVYLGGLKAESPKLICTAVSRRLAQKIAANMNLMESRKQRAHELFMRGEAVTP
ncbi:MAG TPA: hypothetical protein VKW06_00420 [Candidatus Angelobacter sp.]|nr:hypothetical protein [Candidatus Angelobacter sp.]